MNPRAQDLDQPLTSHISGPWRALRRAILGDATPDIRIASVRSLGVFSSEEEATVRTIADHIVPSDATPGAVDTTATQMVLGIIGDRPAEQIDAFKVGLVGVNAVAMQVGGDALYRLDRTTAALVIQQISTAPEFMRFWELLRSLIVLTFYALPEGYEPIGLSGPNIDQGGFPQPTP